ncbi:MAG: hypothetical protein P8M30_13650 [Planctomycetaceae bacterium]|nr:hypothetical protein [Planctomycetaceae bacterium]
MRLTRQFVTRIAITALLLASSSTMISAQEGPKQVFTNRTRFQIPIRYNQEEMSRLGIKEIRLYTSIDQGRRWQIAQTVPPETQKFDFRATADGEYWFAVKTLDGSNNLIPGGATTSPALKIVVDTTKPVFKLQLQPAEAGQVRLAWNAVDRWLNADKMTLEYRQPGEQEWQPIRFTPKASGETTWSVTAGGIVAVRGSITDLSGNLGSNQLQINVTPASSERPKPSEPDFSRPVASDTNIMPHPTVADTNTGGAAPFPAGAFEPSAHPFKKKLVNEPRIPTVANNPFADEKPVDRLDDPIDEWHSTDVPVSDDKKSRPDALKGRYTTESEQPLATRPAVPVRIVRQTKFDIGYELDNVGASGISQVELFITQDDGAHWWRYGADEDRQSPFAVEVPLQGTYGFAIRVQSGAGLANEPPENGAAPEMNVIVDQTGPLAELLAVKPLNGTEGTQLLIRWRVSDKHPSGAPVSLSYAVNEQGPWIPITGWQADEREFAWKVGSQVPAKVFIKLDARDAAGNITSIMSEEAIAIDLAKPSARIVDVETKTGNGLQK